MKKKIVLIGMMGSGKSTIGKMLSKILNLDFVDTDILIEKKCGLTIKQIFKEYNENYFRNVEEKLILNILLNKKRPCVIALGGGAFLKKNLQKIILKKTISIWLDSSVNLIYKRCNKSKKRPLLLTENNKKLKDVIKDLLKKRRKAYVKAEFTVKNNDKPIKVCKKILFKIKKII